VSWSVFEVPSGAKVTSVSVEATAYSSGAQVVITLAGTPQPSASPSFSGDPSPGSGIGPACTTVPGYYPGGVSGHEDSSGFCVPDSTSSPAPEPVIFTAGSYSGTEPSTIDYSGDGGNIATNLQWSSWGSVTAIGYGRVGLNNCTPDCANGTVTYVPVTVTLSNPIQGDPTIWGSMTEQYSVYDASYSYPGTWPLGAS